MPTESESSASRALRRRRSRGLREEADAFLRAHNVPRRHASGASVASAGGRLDASPPPEGLDAARLSKLRDNARSFLDPPAGARGPKKEELQQLHAEAVMFLDHAAARKTPSDGLSGSRSERRGAGRYTAMRIRRDKQRLEQQYQAAMSFLDKADSGDTNVLIEEEEVSAADSAAAEKKQLENYAREAMSFLDKAFKQDESVLIEDDELDPDYRSSGRGKKSNGGGRKGGRRPPADTFPDLPDDVEVDSIAHDRRQLERYVLEAEQFLDGANVDDDPIMQSPVTSRNGFQDDLSDANTDDEFQGDLVDPVIPIDSPAPDRHEKKWSKLAVGSTGADKPDVDMGTQLNMGRYLEEATEFIDHSNIPEEDEHAEIEQVFAAEPEFEPRSARTNLSDGGDDDFNKIVSEIDLDDIDDDADVVGTGVTGSTRLESPFSSAARPPRPGGASPRHIVPAPAPTLPPQLPTNADMTVKVFAPNAENGSKEWVEVPMEPAFYKKIPRGSTVQIMQKRTALPEESGHGPAKSQSQGGMALRSSQGHDDADMNAELLKIAGERDAVIGALEDIVNERNRIAAQVGEMREMIADVVGQQLTPGGKSRDVGDIDLSAELQYAYDTMRQVTEETELTINVLESKHEDMVAEKATLEKLLEENLAQNDVLRTTIREMKRTAPKPCSECLEVPKWKEEVEKSLSAVRDAELAKSELERELQDVKREMESRDRNSASRYSLLEDDQREIRRKYADVETQRDSDRTMIAKLQSSLSEAERRESEAKIALQVSENDLLKERLESAEVSQRSTHLAKFEEEAQAAAKLREESRDQRDEIERLQRNLRIAEQDADKLRLDLAHSRDGNEESATEIRALKAQLEESLRARKLSANTSLENADLHRKLQETKRDGKLREEKMSRNMRELKELADSAMSTAATAEQNAVDAAAAAASAQDNAKKHIEREDMEKRKLETLLAAREKELAAKRDEAKQWEKYARDRAERMASKHSDVSPGLAPSGSRRGVRRGTGSKARPKSGGSNPGTSSDDGRKKKKNFNLFG